MDANLYVKLHRCILCNAYITVFDSSTRPSVFAIHCVSKKRTPKTDCNNFVKIGPLLMIFHRVHRHRLCIKCVIWVEYQLRGFYSNGQRSCQERCASSRRTADPLPRTFDTRVPAKMRQIHSTGVVTYRRAVQTKIPLII